MSRLLWLCTSLKVSCWLQGRGGVSLAHSLIIAAQENFDIYFKTFLVWEVKAGKVAESTSHFHLGIPAKVGSKLL